MKINLLLLLRGLGRFLAPLQRSGPPSVLLACILLSACSTARPQFAASTAAATGHNERAAAFAASASQSVTKIAATAAKMQDAIQKAQRDAQDIKGGRNAIDALQAHLALAQQVNEETQAAADAAQSNLKQARAEGEKTAADLTELKGKVEALAKQEAQAVKDKQFAVARQGEIQKDRDALAGRLDTLAGVLAIVAGLLAWSLFAHWTRGLETVAPWIGVGGPIAGGLFVGGSVFTYLRYLL